MNCIRFLITAFIICTSFVLFGQKTIIKGRITDKETKEPLPFVNVAFKNSKIGTTSNFEGYFSIETYYATDSLTASFVGYKPLSRKVKKDISQTLNFELDPGNVQLQEIIIKPDKKYKDPAIAIMERVVENKKINDRKKLDAYEY